MTVAELLRDVGPTLPLGAQPLVDGDSLSLNTPCLGVTHDSRQVKPGWLFVALRGDRVDGADFASQAVAAGAAAVVAEGHTGSERGVSSVPWVVVSDARQALSELAASYFGHPSREMQVVGVTGTNGKTTTSYLVASIFEAAGTRCGIVGTVAYRIGAREVVAVNTTPEAPDLHALMRQMVDVGCGACAMEVSSHALALHRADSVHVSAAVFTNLTRDHLDFHGDMDRYFAAKARLFEMLPDGAPAVVNTDDPRGLAVVDMARHPVTYALNQAADVTPGPVSLSFDGVEFDARTPQGTVHVRSALVGRPNVYNILAAVGVTSALGVPLEAIERGLSQLHGVPGRFERASSSHDDITVVVDYAHTDDALRNLLEVARPLAKRRLITVFGAGGGRDHTKRPLMGMVAARLSDLVCITSDNPRDEDPLRIIDEVNLGAQAETRQRGAKVLTIVDRGDAIRRVIGQAEPGDVVLIAGRGHEKYQEIGGELVPFDDVVVARDALDTRRLRSRVG